MGQKPIFVAVVHGTWARNSPWPGEGSTFRRILEEELAQPIEFYVVRWSGRNWERDRKRKAQELVGELRAVWENTPNGDRFLVCHSHGGNIGIQAAAMMQEELTGVVCLNTPFISVISQNVIWRLATLGLVLIFAPLLFLMSWLTDGVEDAGSSRFDLLLDLAVLAVLTVAGSLLASLFSALGRLVRARAANLVERMKPTRIERCPILCVVSAGDEATYGLSLLEMLANLPALAQHILALPGLLVVAFAIQALGWVPSVSIGEARTGIVASAWIYLFLLFLGLELLGFFSSLLLRAVPLGVGFGVLKPLAYLAARIVVTPVPLQARIVDFSEVDTSASSVLAHSRIYDDRKAIKIVADWMTGRSSTRTDN
jgi:alpha-beta hydrolase superfamily lysophospholipase